MNRVEQDLSDLLHNTTPEPPVEVSMDGVVWHVRRRRRLSAASTTIGVIAVLATSAALFRPDDHPVAPVDTAAVLGLSRGEEARILSQCRPDSEKAIDQNRSSDAGGPRERATRERLKLQEKSRVYNVLRGPSADYALVYGPAEFRWCIRHKPPGKPAGEFRFAGGSQSMTPTVDYEWLTGDLDVSSRSSRHGTETPGATPDYALVAVGRVSDRVKHVRLDGPGGTSVLVKPVNDTYIAVLEMDPRAFPEAERMVHPVGTATAYGADGVPLARSQAMQAPGCYVTPDGKSLVQGPRPGPGVTCKPAVRWTP